MRGKHLRVAAMTAACAAVVAVLPAAAAPPVPALPALTADLRLPDPARLRPTTSGDGRTAALVLDDTAKYAVGTWWRTVAPALLDRVGSTPREMGSSDAVRRLGMEAFSLATALRTGAYDPARTGVPRAQAVRVVATIVRKVSAAHAANSPNGWGLEGQSSMWSSFTSRAAWLLWDELAPSTQVMARNVLVAEADHALQLPVLYLRDRQGRVVRPGNSASEENSWNALPLQLATTMLPTHKHWASWRHQQITLMLASWARPADTTSTAVVNGAPLAVWIAGSNVESNGVVVNHSRVAPDYATTVYQNVDAVLVDALAGVATPKAALRGLSAVYAGLSQVSFQQGFFNAPGGTIYQGTHVYYPQGCDWGTGQALPYALVDAQSAAFGFGNAQSSAAEQWHLQQHRRMTARFRDGRTYARNSEYRYVGREEHTAQLAAQLYLTLLVRDRGLATFTDAPYFAPAVTNLLGVPEPALDEAPLHLR